MDGLQRTSLIDEVNRRTVALQERTGLRRELSGCPEYVTLATGQDCDWPVFVEQLALASVGIDCALSEVSSTDGAVIRRWLASLDHPFWSRVLPVCLSYASDEVEQVSDGIFSLQEILQSADGAQRRSRGVYYTPREVVDFILEQLSLAAQEHLQCERGLAEIPLRPAGPNAFLDPAVGTGAFVLRLIDHVWDSFAEPATEWNQYVNDHLLPSLHAWDIMLPAAASAMAELAKSLNRTSYDFAEAPQVQLELVNTIRPIELSTARRFKLPVELLQHATQIEEKRQSTQFAVILGNPPFSGVSANDNPWSKRLLYGKHDKSPRWASYFEIDGQPLGEKKVWIHDDYVKFFRFAHWLVEKSGEGLLGLVTNHSFLDSASYRGMRYQLMQTFDSISVMDLNGNAKRRKLTRDDKNVFDISSGVAVTIAARSKGDSVGDCRVRHDSLTGTREFKLRELESTGAKRFQEDLTPVSPTYLWIPQARRHLPELSQHWTLDQVIPVHSTAVVTARDHFITDEDKQSLVERLERFVDLNVSDEEIRRRDFTNSRSNKYLPGDTRGWKLSDARRRLAQTQWRVNIRRCSYRPYDQRWILWDADAIDWPRASVSAHVTAEFANWSLVSRRQMVPNQPANFFWIASGPVLDGLVRSDNRGSESFFPLYCSVDGAPVPNIAPEFQDACNKLVGYVSPVQVFGYLFALFHCQSYRKRYRDLLCANFPIVVLPRSSQMYCKMARLGWRLIRAALPRENRLAMSPVVDCDTMPTVDSGYPRYRDGAVQFNKHFVFPLEQVVWDFRVGSHHVCRKWLLYRKGKKLSQEGLANWISMVNGIRTLNQVCGELEALLGNPDDWPEIMGAGDA